MLSPTAQKLPKTPMTPNAIIIDDVFTSSKTSTEEKTTEWKDNESTSTYNNWGSGSSSSGQGFSNIKGDSDKEGQQHRPSSSMASSMTSSITVVEVQPQQEDPVIEDGRTSPSNSAVLEPVNPTSTIVSSIKVLPVARSNSITRMEIQIASPTLEMTNTSLSPMSPSTTTASSSIVDGEHHLEHMEGIIMNPLAYRSELSGGDIQRREMIEKIIAEKEKATANIDAMLKTIENQLDQTEKERASIISGGDGESEIRQQNHGDEAEGDDSSLPLPPPPLPLP